MRINFITTHPNAAASMFYSNALRKSSSISIFDSNMSGYDVILVMTYDHELIPQIRKLSPSSKIGIIDPRSHKVIDSANLSDFLIVDSIEMEDYWSLCGKPIFRYVEYPDIKTQKRVHVSSNPIRIGYHGNLIHLDCMQSTVTPAISSLSKKFNIELLIMAGGDPPSGSESWIPSGVKVRYTPWSMPNYENFLSNSDIGIVPNNILHTTLEKNDNSPNKKYNYSSDDFSLRFKMPSNPGRFVVFGKLGIPVVADFYPSALQYIREDLKTGFVACTSAGWKRSLERLIESHQLRQEMGDNLQKLVEEKFDFTLQNQKLIEFLRNL